MKKNGVKKLGALVLSGILAVSLVGCGAAGGAKSDDNNVHIACLLEGFRKSLLAILVWLCFTKISRYTAR